jgi:hypothetical protein
MAWNMHEGQDVPGHMVIPLSEELDRLFVLPRGLLLLYLMAIIIDFAGQLILQERNGDAKFFKRNLEAATGVAGAADDTDDEVEGKAFSEWRTACRGIGFGSTRRMSRSPAPCYVKFCDISTSQANKRGTHRIGLLHQQNACHFKMPIWPVDRHEKPVDRVNMAENPVNRTLPCIRAQTIPIQDTVLVNRQHLPVDRTTSLFT